MDYHHVYWNITIHYILIHTTFFGGIPFLGQTPRMIVDVVYGSHPSAEPRPNELWTSLFGRLWRVTGHSWDRNPLTMWSLWLGTPQAKIAHMRSLWYWLHAAHAMLGVNVCKYVSYIQNWAGTRPHLHKRRRLSCKVVYCLVYPFLDMSLKWTASTEWHVNPLNHSAGSTFCKKLRQTSQNLANRKLALVQHHS